MNDPWADVRKKRNRRYMKTPWTDPEIDRLLADADALLAVARAYQEGVTTEWRRIAEDGGTERTLEEWIDDYFPALAALPEHLRGDTNERSRKA